MEIGQVLKKIREEKGLTGAELATELGKSGNSYISKIETGQKKDISLQELKDICNVLKVSPQIFFQKDDKPKRKFFFDNALFRDEDVISEDAQNKIKELLPKIAKSYRVKKSLGDNPITIDSISMGFTVNSVKDAKKLAGLIREKFELGSYAIDIFNLVRSGFNIYVIGEDLGDRISGIYSHDAKGNPVIVYNSASQYQHRNVFTLAHELGHHLIEEGKVVVDELEHQDNQSEHFADAFAAELLTPENSFIQKFKKVFPTNETRIGANHVIELSTVYKVSYRAIIKRLFDLKLISYKTATKLREAKVMWRSDYRPDSYYTPLTIEEQIKIDLLGAIQKGKIGTVKAESILGDEINAE
ncbi:MAG: ImmA/IrrE family metallo-endopeptidase [Bacteriovoracaceae bacterium]|nr:ImmA/IrrE family metallo-endopeptidase [Bacteriovoracaceae bacterium]